MLAARDVAERVESESESESESCGDTVNGGDCRSGRWEDLSRDVLVLIFARLSVADLIIGVPLVCSSWRDAAEDPSCWRTPDFREWATISRRLDLNSPDEFILLLDHCIDRSDEFFDSLHLPHFADEADLLYVADRCPELLYLSIESSEIPVDKFCEAINKFEFLQGIAIDKSLVYHEVLHHVWECCLKFSELKVYADAVDEEMATIICESLPRLQKLEITDCMLSSQAIAKFLDNLKALECFNISGCLNSGITCNVLEKASRLKVFLWDSKPHEGGFYHCPGCNQGHFVESPCEGMVDHEAMEWLAILP